MTSWRQQKEKRRLVRSFWRSFSLDFVNIWAKCVMLLYDHLKDILVA